MKTTIHIQNLKCNGCAQTITDKLSELTGINQVSVDVDADEVELDYQSDQVLITAKQKLLVIGYPEEEEETNSTITKVKSYISCVTGKISSHES